MAIEIIKKRYPIFDENGNACTFPTYASQVFTRNNQPLEDEDGKMTNVIAGDSMKLCGMDVSKFVTKEELDTLVSFDILESYPVGSIYMSVSETSPAELFGGVWEKILGRFLVGTGAPDANDDGTSPGSYDYASGSMGGEEKHKLTISEMPSHTHSHRRESSSGSSDGMNFAMNTSGKYKTDSGYSNSSGGDGAHNNMPPYLAVNMWKRIADEEVA